MSSNLHSVLQEVVSINNVAYMLNNNNEFSMTGYKVMLNQSSIGLLKCAKTMYNGNIKLVYIVGNYKPLSYIINHLEANEINIIIYNLVKKTREIQSNGFFNAENLELDADKIFIDTADYSVHLIYFPVNNLNTVKILDFENEFRNALISLFRSSPSLQTPKFQRLYHDLSNTAIPIDMAIGMVKNNIDINSVISKKVIDTRKDESTGLIISGKKDDKKPHTEPAKGIIPEKIDFNETIDSIAPLSGIDEGKRQPTMKIEALNAPMKTVFIIKTPQYIIGKNPALADGVINYNPAVSRKHCSISFERGKYYITDEGSANGTYLNSKRLNSGVKNELHSGDYLKLANSDFLILF